MKFLPARHPFFRLLAAILIVYLACCALLVWRERSLLYLPRPGISDPKALGLTAFSRRELIRDHHDPIVYWESTAPANAPTILYFHGNGGGLYYHAKSLANLAANGFHIIAMEYPGYPSAPGSPSQSLITADAIALFDTAQQATPKRPIVIWGYSLGTGVAVQLAAIRPSAALVLEAPFTATVDRAAELFPYIPVHLLMRDQYRSRDLIGQIHAPLFIISGDDDQIIPPHHAQALFDLANSPKTIRHYPHTGHLDLLQHGADDDAIAFIRATLKTSAH